MPIIHHNLTRPQINLIPDPRKVPLVLLKDALEGRFELESGKGARALEAGGRVAARIDGLGALVQLVGFGVFVVGVVARVVGMVEGRGAESRALGWGFHGARMAAFFCGAGRVRLRWGF